MRILVVTQYFWPEFFVINQLVQELSNQGHTVQVLTGKPNYPEGKIFSGYKEKDCQWEVFSKNINVFRAPLRPRYSGGSINLARNYLSFIVNGLRFFPKATKGKEYDVVFFFATSPLTSIVPAIYLKYKHKAHLCCWVQDLCPDSLSATGYIKNKVILMMMGWVARILYSFCDTVLIQSKSFTKQILSYTTEDKVFHFPNVLDKKTLEGEGITEVPDHVNEHFKKDFNIVFAGNIGSLQSFPTILAAAKLISDFPIKIIVIGDGSNYEWVLSEVEKLSLKNVVLLGRFPFEMMGGILNKADALLVSLKKDSEGLNYLSLTTPGKVQAYLAKGKPIIASLDGDGKDTILDAKAGLVSPAENVELLAKNIINLSRMSKNELEAFGRNGVDYFLENYEIKMQTNKLVKLLNQRLQQIKD